MMDYSSIMSSLNAYKLRGRATDAASAIQEFELKTRINLPTDYRGFVANWGIYAFRGYVAFPIKGEPPFGNEGLMGVFFGFEPGDGYDLSDTVELYNGRIPDNLIPIAEDPGSNMICLGVKGADYGHVFFWDKENEGYPDAVWPVADSWDEFMHLLKPWRRNNTI